MRATDNSRQPASLIRMFMRVFRIWLCLCLHVLHRNVLAPSFRSLPRPCGNAGESWSPRTQSICIHAKCKWGFMSELRNPIHHIRYAVRNTQQPHSRLNSTRKMGTRSQSEDRAHTAASLAVGNSTRLRKICSIPKVEFVGVCEWVRAEGGEAFRRKLGLKRLWRIRTTPAKSGKLSCGFIEIRMGECHSYIIKTH